MTKQNETFKIGKVYVNGHQFVDKVVGRSALVQYLTKMFDVMGIESVVSVTLTNCGRKENDIERKEQINERAMSAIEDHDMQYTVDERDTDDRSTKEKLADELDVDTEDIDKFKNVFSQLTDDDGEEEKDSGDEEEEEEDEVVTLDTEADNEPDDTILP